MERGGITILSWASQNVIVVSVLVCDRHLAPVENPGAAHAKAPIIERAPVPVLIVRSQQGEPLFVRSRHRQAGKAAFAQVKRAVPKLIAGAGLGRTLRRRPRLAAPWWNQSRGVASHPGVGQCR